MNLKHTLLSLTIASVAALSVAPSAAQAGSLDNAALACYIDTYAWDQLSSDYCGAAWTPGTSNVNSVAYFEVVGLAAGSYSYSWSGAACGNTYSCTTPIRAYPEQTKTLSVTVYNNSTGESKTVSATAEYIDGYH